MLLVWTLAQQRVCDFLCFDHIFCVEMLVTEMMCNIVLFFTNWEIKIQYISPELSNNISCPVIRISAGQHKSHCRKVNSRDDAMENFLLSNPPGHTNYMWRGLQTAVSLQVMVRSLLYPASILMRQLLLGLTDHWDYRILFGIIFCLVSILSINTLRY